MKYAEMTPEQKQKRNKQNAASRAKYEAKAYEKLYIRIRASGEDGFSLDQIRAAAKRDGVSVNAWIIEAIRDKV